MRVKITKVLIKSAKGIDIEFSTEIGNCKGVWMGAKPIVGGIYEIEIEIPRTLKWGHDVLLAQSSLFQMKINENTVSLIGILESAEDNFVALKLDNNRVLLEAEGIPFKEKTFIEVLTDKLLVYDTNL